MNKIFPEGEYDPIYDAWQMTVCRCPASVFLGYFVCFWWRGAWDFRFLSLSPLKNRPRRRRT